MILTDALFSSLYPHRFAHSLSDDCLPSKKVLRRFDFNRSLALSVDDVAALRLRLSDPSALELRSDSLPAF